MEEVDEAAIFAAITEKVKFPWHGVVQIPSLSAVCLLSPFSRATSCLRNQNDIFDIQPRYTFRQEVDAGMFHDRWSQLIYILGKFDDLGQNYCRFEADQNTRIAAAVELPFWIDLFYFYSLPFADAITRCIGILLSGSGGSFPTLAKTLFKSEISDLSRWNLKCRPEMLMEMIDSHREWFQLLRDDQQKSFRNSRVHRLNRICLSGRIKRDPAGSARKSEISAILLGTSPDTSKLDGWETAKQITEGFCSLLGAVPVHAWQQPWFMPSDMTLVEGGELPAFLPRQTI